MKLLRLLSVVLGASAMLIFTLSLSGSVFSQSAATSGEAPNLMVQPTSLTFLTEVSTPTVQTQTLLIAHTIASTTLTWTIAISPVASIQPVVTPISGTNDATVSVQIDSTPVTTTGVYTTHLIITADPTNTPGSPITIPLIVEAVEQISRTYLPLLAWNYSPLTPPPPTSTLQLGLAFISAPEWFAPEYRYEHAQSLGARLNRWPMYWPNIEKDAVKQPRAFDWSAQDANIVKDVAHGLETIPILMLTPPGLDTGGNRAAPMPKVGQRRPFDAGPLSPAQISSVTSPPQGLFDPIFDDGTDMPGPAKSINPDNRWAYFVNAAVTRYKPAGVLAQTQGWINGQGVHYWEIWNEPDFDLFFSGTITDYARLLKVAYVAGKAGDPQAQIVLGGMVHWQNPSWFGDVLNVIETDPDAQANHDFMDKVASHNYFGARGTFNDLLWNRQRLDSHGLTTVGLWLTETGVSVCDDIPNTPCSDTAYAYYRANSSEQADFLIQTATWAAWLSAEKMIWFQLYDDAGNGCDSRDAYGLVRNPATGPCYAGDGSARPSYRTYQVVNDLLTHVEPYWRDRRNITTTNWITGNQEIIAFKQPTTSERIVTMWTRYYTSDVVTLTATSSSAQLVLPDGTSQIITPTNGVYSIPLPAATNRHQKTPDGAELDGTAPIGGSPRILIEYDPAAK